MKRELLLFAAVSAIVSAAPYQSAKDLEAYSPADAHRVASEWLKAADPRDRAWAAYWIARDHDSQLIPDLIGALRSPTSVATPDSAAADKATAAVADALIRSNMEVPVDAAMLLYPKFPAQALILIARRRTAAREPLLRIFNDKRSEVWIPAAALLAHRYPAEITPVLLDGFTMSITISVLDSSHSAYGTDRYSGCGGRVYDDWAGWPKMRDYSLNVDSASGSELPAPGRNPIYYRFEENRNFGVPPRAEACPFDPIQIDRFRFDLLQQLGASELERSAYKKIWFANAEWFKTEVDAFLSEQKRRFDEAVRELVDSGNLSSEKAERQKFYVYFSIDDDRTDKSVPLPIINLNQFGITVRRPPN